MVNLDLLVHRRQARSVVLLPKRIIPGLVELRPELFFGVVSLRVQPFHAIKLEQLLLQIPVGLHESFVRGRRAAPETDVEQLLLGLAVALDFVGVRVHCGLRTLLQRAEPQWVDSVSLVGEVDEFFGGGVW